MILTYGTTSIDIGCAQYPSPNNTQLVQASERSGTGIVYTEDFSVEIGTRTFNFVNMSTEHYLLLMEFFVNTVIGRLYEFTLEDDLGYVSIAKFTESRLGFSHNAYELWSGSFTVEEIT